jgi:DNA polymerase-3 subunit gamma/tau
LTEDPAADIRDALQRTTGGRWQVERAVGEAQPALREVREAEACASRAALLADPMVKAAFAAFPDAELIDEPAPMKPDETDNLFNSRSRRA